MIDHIGRKRIYTTGCLFITVLPLTYLFFTGDLKRFYFFLICVRVLHGIGLALCFTSAFTYVADIIPEQRLNEGIAMFGVTGLTGMAIGPAVAEMIVRHYTFSEAFVFASTMGCLGLLLHIRLPESFSEKRAKPTESFFAVLFRRNPRHVALLTFLLGIGFAASGSFVAPFAKERGLSFVSLYFISYCGAAILTRLFGGQLADRIGEERVIPRAFLVTGAGLLLLLFLKSNFIMFLSGFMSGCGHGFLFPSLSALAIRHEPMEIRGKITGVFTGSLDAGAFAGSVFLGYVGEWLGFRVLFAFAASALFMGFFFFRFGKFDQR
jgi:MFS family permease